MTTEQALTKLKVNLTPFAMTALGEVEASTGDSRTDIVNRALLVYAILVDVGRHEGAYHLSADVAGAPLYLQVCRTPPKKSRWAPW